MKKLVLLLAVVFSVSLFSCGGSEEAKVNQDSIDSVAKADSLAKVAAAAEQAPVVEDSAAVK